MSLVRRIKTAFDESRMLMLGAQILLGFQFEAPFQDAFDELAPREKALEIVALCIMMLVIGLLLAPGARHRIVENGEATREINLFVSQVASFTLLPFALAMALNLHIVGTRIGGLPLGLASAAAGFIIAAGLWYGPLFAPHARQGSTMPQETGRTPTSAKIDYALTEARVILPGAQAMLGFQFVIVLTTGFDDLPWELKAVHGTAIAFIVLATILLMAPAAYHRIVHDGDSVPQVYRIASRLILAATVCLALGLCADLYMVIAKITQSEIVSMVLAIVAAAGLFALWHVWPLAAALGQARQRPRAARPNEP